MGQVETLTVLFTDLVDSTRRRVSIGKAQRLASAATPGQILCSSLLRALVRGRGDHVFRPVGALELKGLGEPLDAEEVVWTPTGTGDDEHPGLPPVLAQLGGFGFAGRRAECEDIASDWERAKRGT